MCAAPGLQSVLIRNITAHSSSCWSLVALFSVSVVFGTFPAAVSGQSSSTTSLSFPDQPLAAVTQWIGTYTDSVHNVGLSRMDQLSAAAAAQYVATARWCHSLPFWRSNSWRPCPAAYQMPVLCGVVESWVRGLLQYVVDTNNKHQHHWRIP